MPAVLTYKGVSISYKEFCKLKGYRDILKSLEIITTLPICKGRTCVKRTELYYKYGDRIMIARFAGFEIFPKVINCLKEHDEIIIDTCNLVLKPHQVSIYEHLMEYVYNDERIAKGTAGCVLSMGAGQGKTWTAMGFIAEFSVKTLIIVPGEALLVQWEKCFQTVFPTLKIGRFYGKKKTDGDIIIMVSKSAIADKFMGKSPIKYFSQFGFIVFDEIHKYPTPTLSKMFWRTCSSRVLGLTASPNSRTDEFDRVYFEHVGEWVKAEDIPGVSFDDIQFDVDVITIEYHGPPQFTEKKCARGSTITSAPLMVKQFMSDPYRTQMIVNLLKWLFNQGRNVYAVSGQRNHLTDIHDRLNKSGIVPDIPEVISTVMGGTDEKELELAQAHARTLLTTYGYGTEGISITCMDTLVLMSPQVSKMDQISGRVKRLGGDSSIRRRIYDIVDWNTSLKNQYYRRRSAFTALGYNILDDHIKISWDGPNNNFSIE